MFTPFFVKDFPFGKVGHICTSSSRSCAAMIWEICFCIFLATSNEYFLGRFSYLVWYNFETFHAWFGSHLSYAYDAL